MMRKQKNPKLVLILTGIAFIASGMDSLENVSLMLGVLSILVGALNLLAVLIVKKHNFITNLSLMVVNVIFALVSAYFLANAGKEYIQYGWLLVAIVYVVASIRYYRKIKLETDL